MYVPLHIIALAQHFKHLIASINNECSCCRKLKQFSTENNKKNRQFLSLLFRNH